MTKITNIQSLIIIMIIINVVFPTKPVKANSFNTQD